jgi:hypothetical protein
VISPKSWASHQNSKDNENKKEKKKERRKTIMMKNGIHIITAMKRKRNRGLIANQKTIQ